MDDDRQAQIVSELSDAAMEVTAGSVRGVCLMLEHYDGTVSIFYQAPNGSVLEILTDLGDGDADAYTGAGQTCH